MFGVDLFVNQVLKLGNFPCTLIIEIGLFGVEDMIELQQEHLLGLAGGFIFLNGTLPEDDNGGFFALANLPAIGADLLKGAIDTALVGIGRKYQAVDAPVVVPVHANRRGNLPELHPASGGFEVCNDLFGDGCIDL